MEKTALIMKQLLTPTLRKAMRTMRRRLAEATRASKEYQNHRNTNIFSEMMLGARTQRYLKRGSVQIECILPHIQLYTTNQNSFLF